MEFRKLQKGSRPLPGEVIILEKGMVILEIDIVALKRKIAERNTTMEGVALFLGIDRSTLYRKLRDGGCGITVCEAHMIASFLGLSYEETIRIFWHRRGSFRRAGTAENMLSFPL